MATNQYNSTTAFMLNADCNEFCHGLKVLCNITSTPVGNTALKNTMSKLFAILLDTNSTTFSPKADMKPFELKLDFIQLCFAVTVEWFVKTYPRIQQILLDEIDRIHYDHLSEYCSIYRKNIDTVTATELARAMIRGIGVSYRDATGNKATHFGVAFLHLGMIHKYSNLEHVIKTDINKFSDVYSANDLFAHLIANGRA
jgi:hypothetical protein